MNGHHPQQILASGSGIGAGLGVDKKLRGERGGENLLRKHHNPFMITSPMKYSVSPG